MKVTSLTKKTGMVQGFPALSIENEKEYDLKAKVVINATGVFADSIRRMDDNNAKDVIVPSQGVHNNC